MGGGVVTANPQMKKRLDSKEQDLTPAKYPYRQDNVQFFCCNINIPQFLKFFKMLGFVNAVIETIATLR